MAEFLSKIDIRKILQYALYMLIILVCQNMLLSQLRIFGVCCMFLPAAVVAVSMYEGSVFSAVFAIILGIYGDMAFVENSMTFTIVFPVLSFAMGFISRFFINKQFLAYMIAAVLALAAVAVVQMLKTLAGDVWSSSMLQTVILQVLWSIPPAAAVYFFPASRANQ